MQIFVFLLSAFTAAFSKGAIHEDDTRRTQGDSIASDTPSDILIGTDPPLPTIIDPAGKDGWNEELECYFNLTLVHNLTWSVSPFTEKKFVLCPNTVFEVGTYLEAVIYEGQEPLQPRQNTEYLCGTDGKSTNNCTIYGGNIQFDTLYLTFGQEPGYNIKVKGIIFETPLLLSVNLAARGDIEFHDCIWKNQFGTQVIQMWNGLGLRRLKEVRNFGLGKDSNFFATNNFLASKRFERKTLEHEFKNAKHERRRLQEVHRLKVSFFSCVWDGNIIPTGEAPFAVGLIRVDTPYQDVTFRDCLFVNNMYDGPNISEEGFAYSQALGNNLNITNTCIVNNQFRSSGVFIVGDFENDVLSSENNFAAAPDNSPGCPFIYDQASDQCIPGVEAPHSVGVCSKVKKADEPTISPTTTIPTNNSLANGDDNDTSGTFVHVRSLTSFLIFLSFLPIFFFPF